MESSILLTHGAAMGVVVIPLFFWIGTMGIFGIPFYRILQRAGLPHALIGLLVIPILGVAIMLGVLAFKAWPNEPEGYR